MKRNNVIIGSVVIVATAALFAVSKWKPVDSEGSYTQEAFSSLTEKSASDAQLWMERRYLDPETGERILNKQLRQIDAGVSQMKKSRAVTFIEQGPDNIGGRTRAIQVDVTNSNIIWAGGVSGGLFKSLNGANSWERVDAYEVNCSPFISSMCQFTNGTLFVATGSNEDNWEGDGVWYTQDQGASWTQVPGTNSFSSGRVTEIVAPENGTTLWLTSSNGLKKWDFGSTSLTNAPTGSSVCSALACSPNGQIIIAAIGGSKSTYVSTDFGATFIDKSGFGAGVVPIGAPRIEYAVSHSPNSSGDYSLYAVRTNSNLMGMNVSHDNGNTWSEFVGSSGTPSNLDIYRDQGGYNSVVSVTPQNPKKILVGGIDLWKWEQTTSNPVAGGFEKLSEWFLQPTSSKYVHADNHEMKWDGNKLYIGNDGGIGVSFDPETAFFPANRGYNITQFYGIAFDRNGAVLGGAQDNGSLYNDHQLSTFKEFTEVSGGDGFQCEISFFNPKIMFTTSQYGTGMRTIDGGQTIESFVPNPLPSGYDPFGTDASPNHPFHTHIFLAEHYDLNSRDSVLFVPDANYAIGATILVPSAASGDSISYTLTEPLYFSDTLNYELILSVTETSIVNELTGQTVFLDLYPWAHLGTSGSGLVPPIVGDSLLVELETGTETMIVESLGSYTHYYGQHTSTLDIYDMGTDSISYNVAWNNAIIQDPYQSWYFTYVNTANGGELWGTRNALRLSAQDQQWGVVARGLGNVATGSNQHGRLDIEFSKDLNNIYISSGISTIIRLDGLGDQYTSDANFQENAFYHPIGLSDTMPVGTSTTSFNVGNITEGIGLNPSDPNDLVIFTGFSSNNIKRSSNAASASPTVTNVGSINGALSPISYDGIIDRENPNIIVVGTSHGVFITEDAGSLNPTWEDGSIGFSGTPVFEVRQSWRTWDEGNFRPGEIYIGTYGRGIWSSSSYLSTNDHNNQSNNGAPVEEFNTNLTPFPNPTSTSTSLSFELANTSEVKIQVYNLSGRLVKSISKKNLGQGSHIIDIEGANLSAGTYVVKLSAGRQQATTKFVKM
ncbi:MAG: T9SS type A sorting domain-containing protein [Crocinitomicaceae bacterium]|nr:T9SS type A sorting domain-containing protein [Flavobacteriales bacterium]NQZ34559.1 T9SS type A sorting domain-containing protein [Crocinitomicaceae bacterium]